MSGLDHRLEPEAEIRRFEVINGAMGRRRWSADDRARILEETLAPGAVVSAVARRHGLTPQQLFTWRREARKRGEADAKALAFVPAVVAPEPATPQEPKPPRAKRRAPRRRTAAIEVEASGITVRIGDGASSATIAAVTLVQFFQMRRLHAVPLLSPSDSTTIGKYCAVACRHVPHHPG